MKVVFFTGTYARELFSLDFHPPHHHPSENLSCRRFIEANTQFDIRKGLNEHGTNNHTSITTADNDKS